MERKNILISQGLFKIFDEIIVNAADCHSRDQKTNKIEVKISMETGEISVWNNGTAIPVTMHQKE